MSYKWQKNYLDDQKKIQFHHFCVCGVGAWTQTLLYYLWCFKNMLYPHWEGTNPLWNCSQWLQFICNFMSNMSSFITFIAGYTMENIHQKHFQTYFIFQGKLRFLLVKRWGLEVVKRLPGCRYVNLLKRIKGNTPLKSSMAKNPISAYLIYLDKVEYYIYGSHNAWWIFINCINWNNYWKNRKLVVKFSQVVKFYLFLNSFSLGLFHTCSCRFRFQYGVRF